MNLTAFDWGIVIVCVAGMSAFALVTFRLTRSVADFLVASRSGGRYIASVAGTMAGTGAITMVGWFEMYYNTGMTSIWWGLMFIPAIVIITMTGWVYYRFRETRALTLAQFLEQRYGPRFRVFAGLMAYLSGIVNFGIFPAVASRFFVYFCGFPPEVQVLGLSVPTFALVMVVTLGMALLFTMGGQVTVMLTDCAIGIPFGIAAVIAALVVFHQFGWSQILEGLYIAPEGASRLHPFRSMGVKDFNVWYFLISFVGIFYTHMAWQGSQAYNASAISPHEQKMGNIILGWRWAAQMLMLYVLVFAAYAFLNLPDFASQAAAVDTYLATAPSEFVAAQMRVPAALGVFLPAGIKGLLFAVVLFALITSQDTYLHSWGSIFIQDVYLPLRKDKTPLDPNFHIRVLRWSIIGVAVFAFLFAYFYPPTESIFMFQAITGTIFMGGAGAVIIGGLYWKRSTTPAAYTAIITGGVLGIFGLVIRKFVPSWPINEQWMYAIAMASAVVLFIVVSLLTGRKKESVNMERLMHRGKYDTAGDHVPVEKTLRTRWQSYVGITKEFTKWDKVLAFALVGWNAGWIVIFVVGTIYNLLVDVPTAWWAKYWHVYMWVQIIIAVPTVVWFSIGATLDIKGVFRRLREQQIDVSDDGVVRSSEEEQDVGEQLGAAGTEQHRKTLRP